MIDIKQTDFKNNEDNHFLVLRRPQKLGVGTLSRLMEDCLPELIYDERDMQKIIDKLWPALCCEFEIVDHDCSAYDPTKGKYGEVLKPFLTMMDKELHSNASKGDRPGWLSMTPEIGMLEIYYHVAKLQKAVKNGDIDGVKEYAADVANMAMMEVDICGGLGAGIAAPEKERGGES